MDRELVLWYPRTNCEMAKDSAVDFAALYRQFQAPITALDCGKRCAPLNERGVPFCCDTRQAVPSAYQEEWGYLKANSDLWHAWEGHDQAETVRLQSQVSEGQVLLACLGHTLCQRNFRSIACRSFPFFPYLTRQGEFIGLTYYWEYEDRCWVISNLRIVTVEYRAQFIAAYDEIFRRMPVDKENFRLYSTLMRKVLGRQKRAIPLLHRNGSVYKVTPRNGRMRRAEVESLPKFGTYKIAAEMPFPDEDQA